MKNLITLAVLVVMAVSIATATVATETVVAETQDWNQCSGKRSS